MGRKAWFGPRRLGWGLGPVSPEGWVAAGVSVVLIVVLVSVDRHHAWVALIVAAALVALSFLKGTSPGGPREWEEFRAQRDGGQDSGTFGA